MASIEALSPVFSVDPQQGHFCVTLQGQSKLLSVGNRLAGSRDLVGLYVTESAEPGYQPDSAQYGRVVALVRMLPMPPGHTVQNYVSGCLELRGNQMVDRWPIGWPSETVFFCPQGGPVLRDAVSSALQIHNYAGFAGQFLQGPIDIHLMHPLKKVLMKEVLYQISLNPATQLRTL